MPNFRCPVWAGGNSPSPVHSLPHLLLYLLLSLNFPFLTRFVYVLAFPFLPILPE